MISEHIHSDIMYAKDRLEEAKASFKLAVDTVQAECKHEKVIECPYATYKYLGGFAYPRRMCLCCGYEEAAPHWPCWRAVPEMGTDTPDDGERHPTILNTEFVKKMTRDEFMACRFT